MCPANEKRCYFVTASLVVWAHTQNHGWPSTQPSRPADNRASRSTQPGKLQTKWRYGNALIRHQTALFRAFMCHKNNRCQSIVFIDSETYVGQSQWLQRIFESKKGICKHVRLIVKTNRRACVRSELGCVHGHVLGAFMFGCVLSARPINRSDTAINQEHDIMHKKLTDFFSVIWSHCGNFGFSRVSTMHSIIMNWN